MNENMKTEYKTTTTKNFPMGIGSNHDVINRSLCGYNHFVYRNENEDGSDIKPYTKCTRD